MQVSRSCGAWPDAGRRGAFGAYLPTPLSFRTLHGEFRVRKTQGKAIYVTARLANITL